MEKTKKPTEKTKSKVLLFSSLMLLLAFFLSFSAGEIFLRIVKYAGKDYRPRPMGAWTICRYDPVLGWRTKPGRYVTAPHTYFENGLTMTILPNGARATIPHNTHKGRSIMAIGCSVTQGWETSDDETFLYKLQQRYPLTEFVNLGCIGYGTYQSFLLLKEYLRHSDNVPSVVIYGFLEYHQNRNVADTDWLLYLSRAAKVGHVYLPYCLTDEKGGLQCFPPQKYPQWILDRSSALVNFLKDQYMKRKNSWRLKQRNTVTKLLLSEIDAWCRAREIKFYVVLLDASEKTKDDYMNFLRDKNIGAVDCTDERSGLAEMRVAGGSHPNGKMHTIWADCIERGLQREINKK